MPARSRIAVSAAASSTHGEKDCAQSSRAACATDSCNGERGRSVNSGQSSAWAFVIPGVMPIRPALSFTAKTFSSGGLPSKIATARACNSGSARNTAATEKFGTKMQANMSSTQYPVVSTQLGFSGNWVLATGYCFLSRPGGFADECDLGGTNRFAIQVGIAPTPP